MAGGTASRRSFIAGALGSAIAVPGFMSVASAQTSTTMTAWRLDPDWGYPRGPNGKTHLYSNASRNCARFRWALSEADAECMNLHVGSWAPAVPVAVDRAAFMQIWNAPGGAYVWRNPWKNVDVQIFDERCLPHIAGSGPIWDRALRPFVPAVYTPFTNSPETPESVVEAPVAAVPVAAQPARTASGDGFLALTGGDISLRAALSLGLVASGAAFVRISQRRQELFEQAQAELDD